MHHHDIAPCKGCTDRHSCCHDTCERYKTWKQSRDEALKEQREDKGADVVISNGVQRTLRKWRRSKK